MNQSVAFENSVWEWVCRHALIRPGSRLLLAVSGGIDSMAMLDVFVRLKKAGAIDAELAAAHVNHQLRGAESEDDCRFVQEQAAVRGVAFFSCSADAAAYARHHRLSLETAARMVRLERLVHMARLWKADAAATAHHQDDQVETMVFRLLRGSGFRGLCGIQPSIVLDGIRFVRPLLGVSRRQILAYCLSRGLRWREDSTNADIRFARNRIRHFLLPFLRQHAREPIDAALIELSQRCRHLFERVDEEVGRLLERAVCVSSSGRIELDRRILREVQPLVLGELFVRCLQQLETGLQDYSRRHYRQFLEAVYQGRGGRWSFPGEVDCVIREQRVYLCRKEGGREQENWEPVVVSVGRVSQWGPWRIEAALLEGACWEEVSSKEPGGWTEYFDAERICWPVRVRLRRAGDKFVPLGMKKAKKVGKFLTSSKTSSRLKEDCLIVEDAEKILWVAPLRISEEAKIDPQTKKTLRISITRQGGIVC